ncbi:MAG: metallophosphoesterase [Thermoanaerobaculales bacterium]
MSGLSCFFTSDLHGSSGRFRKLFAAIESERPTAVFLGGDLLPHHWASLLGAEDFIGERLAPGIRRLRQELGRESPRIFLILGNDDDRASEQCFLAGQEEGLWEYAHETWGDLHRFQVLGYSYVPPTPFLLKDWERYDVSRFTDPGSVSPEEGQRTVPVDPDEVRFGTIATDLERLTEGRDLDRAIILFHSPPYDSLLDRAGLDGRSVDHVPLDVHVGSIAIARFIEKRQPLLTLHGHIHESARLTGSWRQQFGRTHAFSGAHDGPELALVRFDLEDLEGATRELV